MTLKLRIN